MLADRGVKPGAAFIQFVCWIEAGIASLVGPFLPGLRLEDPLR